MSTDHATSTDHAMSTDATSSIEITLNGQPRVVDDRTTLHELVPSAQGVAVAVNGAVVPASSWRSTRLSPSDVVEVVTAYQGG